MQALAFAEVQQHFADTEAGTSPSPHHSRAAARADVLQLQQLAQHNSTSLSYFTSADVESVQKYTKRRISTSKLKRDFAKHSCVCQDT